MIKQIQPQINADENICSQLMLLNFAIGARMTDFTGADVKDW